MSNEIKLKMELPDGFVQACEAMKIDPQTALQILINHLNFYAQLASPGDDPCSQAGIVLREYLDSRRLTPVPDYRTRNINVKYTREVLAMMMDTRMTGAKRQKRYLQIVDNWYHELQLVNN